MTGLFFIIGFAIVTYLFSQFAWHIYERYKGTHYKKLDHAFDHWFEHFDSYLYARQDCIDMGNRLYVTGWLCRQCGHVKNVTKRFRGDVEVWKDVLEDRQRFDNTRIPEGTVELPPGIKPWM